MQSLYSFVLLAVLASSALAQTTVSLLIDLPGYTASGTLPNLSNTLTQVSSRKGSAFRFGSTYDSYTSSQTSWAINNVAGKFFNHWVAENSCKWQGTEPSRGTSSLGGCQNVQNFATAHGGSFRGHNTFWHAQTPVRSVVF
jgi:endo-1,4-beta-xylanase